MSIAGKVVETLCRGDLVTDCHTRFFLRRGDRVYRSQMPLGDVDPNNPVVTVEYFGSYSGDSFIKGFEWQPYMP